MAYSVLKELYPAKDAYEIVTESVDDIDKAIENAVQETEFNRNAVRYVVQDNETKKIVWGIGPQREDSRVAEIIKKAQYAIALYHRIEYEIGALSDTDQARLHGCFIYLEREAGKAVKRTGFHLIEQGRK